MPTFDYGAGDFVKSQSDFSEYYAGFGWFGTLAVMRPGVGYQLYLQSSEERSSGISGVYEPVMVDDRRRLAVEPQRPARADANETAALIRIWNLFDGKQHATLKTWQRMERLHNARRPGLDTLVLPKTDKRHLAPERRLHKIFKGRIMSARSEVAGDHIDRAISWLDEQRATGRELREKHKSKTKAQARRLLSRELGSVLGVDQDTARGLVTKLKQRKKL